MKRRWRLTDAASLLALAGALAVALVVADAGRPAEAPRQHAMVAPPAVPVPKWESMHRGHEAHEAFLELNALLRDARKGVDAAWLEEARAQLDRWPLHEIMEEPRANRHVMMALTHLIRHVDARDRADFIAWAAREHADALVRGIAARVESAWAESP